MKFSGLKEVSSNKAIAVNAAGYILRRNQKRLKLTPREKEIALLYIEGLQRKEIAEMLRITVGTVKSHQHNIYTKLKVKNKVELYNLFRIKGKIE